MLLMAAFMLLCCSHALAESMQAVPAGRIQNVTLPEGIVTIGNPVITNGKISVRVDDDNTNWTEVLMKAASRDGLGVSLTIAAPDGAVAGVRENFASDDGETLDAIARGMAPEWFDYAPEPLAGNSVDGSAMFAEIRFGQTTYVEPIAASGAGTVICWENAGGQRQYEYVQWEIIHSNAGLREVPMPALTKKMLSSVSAALPAGVTAEIEMGGVTCTVEDFLAFDTLPIVINAPAGATEAVVYSINGEESVPVIGEYQVDALGDEAVDYRGAAVLLSERVPLGKSDAVLAEGLDKGVLEASRGLAEGYVFHLFADADGIAVEGVVGAFARAAILLKLLMHP